MTQTSYTFPVIGTVHSPYREKFGIPRQPGLVPQARARLVLAPQYSDPACLQGLAQFSHVWLQFVFHETADQGWQPMVRPPRLGGNARVGVFASRSMFRPSPIGLSVVELLDIVDGPQGKELLLGGVDLLDGTPVLDIKPYLPYADGIADARAGFAPTQPSLLPVQWEAVALTAADALQLTADFCHFIEAVLAQDPRPAYHAASHGDREYGMVLADVDVRFRVGDQGVHVVDVRPASENRAGESE